MTDPTNHDVDDDGPARLSLTEATEQLAARARPPAPRLEASIDRSADAAAARALTRQADWTTTVPPRLHPAALEHLAGVEGGLEISEWAITSAWSTGQNLVILGATGVGKSYAAVAAVRAAVDRGIGCLYWSVPDLIAALHWEADDHRRVLARAQVVPVLILDDLGAEGATEWTQRQLYRLLEARDRDRRSTIATSNLEPEDLADAIGARNYSRLAGGAVAVRLVGPDRRRTSRGA